MTEFTQLQGVPKLSPPIPRQTVSWLGKIDNGNLKYIQFKKSLQNIMQYDCNLGSLGSNYKN